MRAKDERKLAYLREHMKTDPGLPVPAEYVAAALEALVEAEQERDAAVADNAALVEWIDKWGHATWCEREQDKALRCSEQCNAAIVSEPHPGAVLLEEVRGLRETKALLQDVAKVARGLMPMNDAVDTVLGPLLTQHQKELEAERTRLRGVMERLAEEVSHFTDRACAADFMAVLNGIEDVAKHSRNEGLEKAVVYLRALMPEATIMPTTRNVVLKAAAAIDALKEPEE